MEFDQNRPEYPQGSEDRANQPSDCASCIQPFGCLLAAHIETGEILYASRNCPEFLGVDMGLILGVKLSDVIGATTWHGARNAAGLPGFEKRRVELDALHIGGFDLAASVSQSGPFFVVELEPESASPTLSPYAFREQDFIFKKLAACDDLDTLFATTTRLARHLTGFDRVMLERFDRNGMGAVISESKTGSNEPMIGQRISYWDRPTNGGIPASLAHPSLVSDVDAAPVEIVAAKQNAPSLDLPYVLLRSPPPGHLAQMKNMGSKASLTLPIVIGSTPWGTLSFHHKTARTPSTLDRRTLGHALLPFFTVKLEQLQDRETLFVFKKFSALQMTLHRQLGQKRDLDQAISLIGPEICNVLKIDGFALAIDSASYSFGLVPSQATIDVLTVRAETSGEKIQQFELFDDALVPSRASKDASGTALVLADGIANFLIVFRRVKTSSPPQNRQSKKDNEQMKVTQRTQLLEEPWTPEDFERAEQLRSLLALLR